MQYVRVSLQTTPALALGVLVGEHWNMTSSPVHKSLYYFTSATQDGAERVVV